MLEKLFGRVRKIIRRSNPRCKYLETKYCDCGDMPKYECWHRGIKNYYSESRKAGCYLNAEENEGLDEVAFGAVDLSVNDNKTLINNEEKEKWLMLKK